MILLVFLFMCKALLLYFFVLPSLCVASLYDRKEVFEVALEQNRPIVAVFLGEDGCPWSQKIEKELFNSPFFKRTASVSPSL